MNSLFVQNDFDKDEIAAQGSKLMNSSTQQAVTHQPRHGRFARSASTTPFCADDRPTHYALRGRQEEPHPCRLGGHNDSVLR